MEFVNRNEEIAYLKSYFATEPNALLFIYGPKSCGKSTLLIHLAELLDTKKFSINMMDLRRMDINNYKSFRDAFFFTDTQSKVKDVLEGITINAGFIKVAFDEKSLFRKNPYQVIENRLVAAKKRGITPILIIDEIQLLKPIKANGDSYLMDKLFNLFIGLTKVLHAAHVVLATSDSYFMEEIYSSSKLSAACEFYLLNHLPKQYVRDWLTKEEFATEEINIIWDKIGGSPFYLQQLLC